MSSNNLVNLSCLKYFIFKKNLTLHNCGATSTCGFITFLNMRVLNDVWMVQREMLVLVKIILFENVYECIFLHAIDNNDKCPCIKLSQTMILMQK